MVTRRTATTTTWSAATGFTINKPTGVVQGDLLFTIIASDSSTATTLSGWTLGTVQNIKLNVSSGNLLVGVGAGNVRIYWKEAGASEPASYSWTGMASNTGNATLLAYTGVTAQKMSGAFVAPFLFDAAETMSRSGSTIQAPRTFNGCDHASDVVVCIMVAMQQNAGVTTNLSAPLPGTMVQQSNFAQVGISVLVADEIVDGRSSSGPIEAQAIRSCTTDTGSGNGGGITFAFNSPNVVGGGSSIGISAGAPAGIIGAYGIKRSWA